VARRGRAAGAERIRAQRRRADGVEEGCADGAEMEARWLGAVVVDGRGRWIGRRFGMIFFLMWRIGSSCGWIDRLVILDV